MLCFAMINSVLVSLLYAGFVSGQSIVCFCQAGSTTTEHLLHVYSLHATTAEHLLQHTHHTRQQQNICCSIPKTRDNNGTSAAAFSPHATTAEQLLHTYSLQATTTEHLLHAYPLQATTTEHLLHAYPLHATTNIVRAIRRTGTKLHSGSEKLRKVYSGTIRPVRPVRRTLSLTV